MPNIQDIERLRGLLEKGPTRTSAILRELGVSQPTFSRMWATVRDGVVLGAGKARHYALRRNVAQVEAPIPVFRVSAQGRPELIGYLDGLCGGFYAMTPLHGTSYDLHQGLPFFIQDLRPQGFLGRLEPRRHRDLDLPASILHWTDEHVLKYVAKRSDDVPGDLIFGNESYARLIESSTAQSNSMLSEAARAARYPVMAESAMQGEAPGSSAGGEQPKFTAVIRRGADDSMMEHVIVKFSPPVDAPPGKRWGDLLVCEHLASLLLGSHGIAAAKTSILASADRIFLEVVRFDRVGFRGRRPMVTFSALDGDLGMMDQSWSAVARELGRLGQLPKEDIATVEVLDLFGALIGNTDKHHGNIAVAWTFERQHRLLDAYDTLPMLYRPNAHGEVVDRQWTASSLDRMELLHTVMMHT